MYIYADYVCAVAVAVGAGACAYADYVCVVDACF